MRKTQNRMVSQHKAVSSQHKVSQSGIPFDGFSKLYVDNAVLRFSHEYIVS
jgi:hypothetical protein